MPVSGGQEGEVLALCADCFDDIVCDAPFFLLSSSSASRIFIFNFFSEWRRPFIYFVNDGQQLGDHFCANGDR
jgi:hypothetical protein